MKQTRAEKQQWTEGYLDDLNRRADQAANTPIVVQGTAARNLRNIDNLMLIQNVDNEGKKIALPKPVIDKLRTATNNFVTGTGVAAQSLQREHQSGYLQQSQRLKKKAD